jgi:hypothetical protein
MKIIPTAGELEALFREGKMERIGDGSRRVCYALPGGKFCVKSYRSENDLDTRMKPDGTLEKHPLKPSVLREIRRARFDEKRNTSCQEYRYWQELGRRLPAELSAVFPEYVEQVLVPSRGWCLIENLICNADGSPVRKFAMEYGASDEVRRDVLMRDMERLMGMLAGNRVRFYDPQNIMVQTDTQGNFKLRIVDFEPVSRTLIPLDLLIPCLLPFRMRRRFSRFKSHLKGGVYV